MTGILAPLAVYVLVLVLHLAVPARTVEGYVTGADGKPLRYRLNGLRVFLLTVALWAMECRMGNLPWDFFWTHRFAALASAFVLGILFSIAIVLPASPTGKGTLADLYLGRLPNPQAVGVDAKMYLYLVGATMLELNILSFAAHHVLTHPGNVSPGVLLYTALFTFFLTEYLFFERVHLYTYDFVAERVGFKLGWGCLVFYPFFYCVGLWTTAERPNPGTPLPLLALSAAIFFCGWSLARGANMQKFHFKLDPARPFLGIVPEALRGADGRRVLVNGWWGVSRHVNYLGEILMATGLALSLGYPLAIGPWLYPLYYLALLVPRQIDDDARCRAKYGPLWDEYRQRVPYRIIPKVY